MKKLNTIILIICISFLKINAQEIGATYKFNVPVEGDKIQYKEGHKVKVTDTTKTHVSFVYLKFSKKSEKSDTLNNWYYYETIKDSVGNNFIGIFEQNVGENESKSQDLGKLKIHQLKKSIFNEATSRYYYYHRFKGVKAGIFTVPFKIRLNDFDFEQNVNLGMSVSFRFRLNRKFENDWLLSPTIGVGLSTVKLNPKNSDLTEEDDANRTASALSLSGGLLVELKENINLNFQYGFDFLGNDDKDINWKYDRKPWLGIGISIGFPISGEETENETEN